LSISRQTTLDTLLPDLQLKTEDLKEDGSLDPATLYSKKYARTVLEIGIGNGEHLANMMRARPDAAYIGAEPFINGMTAFLKSINDDPKNNIRVWMDDALMIVRSLDDASLDAIYILNPDPWPKTRHHKRRIVRLETLAHYHRVLKPGGELIMATDVDDLAEWMLTQTILHGGFDWQAESAADWKIMPTGWFATRYETKGKQAGRSQSYILFKKKA
jgi:tRNA (guanine-N7-)-methyltransferase